MSVAVEAEPTLQPEESRLLDILPLRQPGNDYPMASFPVGSQINPGQVVDRLGDREDGLTAGKLSARDVALGFPILSKLIGGEKEDAAVRPAGIGTRSPWARESEF